MAFTQNISPTFVRQPNIALTKVTTGAGTASAVTALYTGGSNGSKIIAVMAAGVTTAAFDARISVVSGPSIYLTTVSLPSNGGTVSTAGGINLMTPANVPNLPLDSDGNPFIYLGSSLDVLSIQVTNSSSLWAAGSFVSFMAIGGDF